MYDDMECFLSSTSRNFFPMLIVGTAMSIHMLADVVHYEFAESIQTAQAQ